MYLRLTGRLFQAQNHSEEVDELETGLEGITTGAAATSSQRQPPTTVHQPQPIRPAGAAASQPQPGADRHRVFGGPLPPPSAAPSGAVDMSKFDAVAERFEQPAQHRRTAASHYNRAQPTVVAPQPAMGEFYGGIYYNLAS